MEYGVTTGEGSSSNNLYDLVKALNINVEFGDNVKYIKDKKKIIIPRGFQYVNVDIGLGLVLIMKGLGDEEFTLSDILGVSDFEMNQISMVSKLLYGAEKIRNEMFFYDCKKYTDLFFGWLTHRFGQTTLYEFLKDVINNNIYDKQSFQVLYNQIGNSYIRYKMYNYKKEDGQCLFDCATGQDGSIEQNSIVQQDIRFGEHIPGADNGVFGIFDPKLPISCFYCQDFISERYDLNLNRFVVNHRDKTPCSSELIEPPHKCEYFVLKGKNYTFPLPRGYKISRFDHEKVEIMKDQYNLFYLNPKVSGKIILGVDKDFDYRTFDDIEEAFKKIYSGSKIDISQWETPFDIRTWIINNKKYDEKHQKRLLDTSGDVNGYIENLYNADRIECLSANMLLVAMSRAIGFPARIVTGFMLYNKTGKSYLSFNKGHAWAEVYINGNWISIDATPIDNDRLGNGGEKGESIDATPIDNDRLGNGGESIESMITTSGSDMDDQNKNSSEGSNNLVGVDSGNRKEDLVSEGLFKLLSENLDPIIISAIRFVWKDAQEIISYLINIKKIRDENSSKGIIGMRKSRLISGLIDGELVITSDTLQRMSVGDPSIFSKRIKNKPKPLSDKNTDFDMAVAACDVSGSMGNITGNWNAPTKMDSMFLSLILKGLIFKEFNIPYSIVLFASKTVKLNEPLFLNGGINPKFYEEFKATSKKVGEGNEGNASGVLLGVRQIVSSKKGLLSIYSDGDGGTNLFFPPDSSAESIILGNKGIVVVGYGLGEDATNIFGIENGVLKTVIERQTFVKGETDRVRGFNVKDYQTLVSIVKSHLAMLFVSKHVKLG